MLAILFGDTIRDLRYSRRMTQAELAERVGITRPVISAYENNFRQPSHEVLWKMASIFNVSIDYLYNFKNSQRIKDNLDLAGMDHEHRFLLEGIAEIIRVNERIAHSDKEE